jgi:hypothetical protein
LRYRNARDDRSHTFAKARATPRLTGDRTKRKGRVSENRATSGDKMGCEMLGKGSLVYPGRITKMQIADAAPLAQQNLHTLKRSFLASQIDDLEMLLVREIIVFCARKTIHVLPGHQMSRESFQSTSHSQSNPRNTDLDATREDSAALGSSRPSILRTTLRLPSAPTIHPALIVSEVSPRATVASTPLSSIYAVASLDESNL